ncbi:MAG: hypothetical protein EBT77_03020, partial [Verrucomicrobia bacterium]|nr:hypothetical protein [Verrucomicrobiota bacterium]
MNNVAILDQPQSYDNNGRECRILAALQELPLARTVSFSRGMNRMQTWRISAASGAFSVTCVAALLAFATRQPTSPTNARAT